MINICIKCTQDKITCLKGKNFWKELFESYHKRNKTYLCSIDVKECNPNCDSEDCQEDYIDCEVISTPPENCPYYLEIILNREKNEE